MFCGCAGYEKKEAEESKRGKGTRGEGKFPSQRGGTYRKYRR